MLPPVFAIVHPRFKTPIVTTIVAGLGASVIAGLLPIGVLGGACVYKTKIAHLSYLHCWCW